MSARVDSPARRRVRPPHTAAALALSLLFAACSDDPQSPPPVDTPLEPVRWTRVAGGFGADSLFAVFAAAVDRAVIATNEGFIRHDGTAWRFETPGFPMPRVRALWATANFSHVFAGGDDGAILLRNGGAWSEMASPVTTRINDVAGLSATRVYACGAGATAGSGVLLGFDGASWTTLSETPEELFGVWPASEGDVFVVGRDGYFARFNGASMVLILPNHGIDLHDVWAADAANAFAVGEFGVVLRYTGASSYTSTAGSAVLRSVSGNSPYSVVVAGDDGTLKHFDGNNWVTASIGLEDDYIGASGFGTDEALVVGRDGSTVYATNGGWQVLLAGSRHTLRAVAYDIIVGEADGGGGVAVVGADTYAFPDALFGVTAFTPLNAYAVGANGTIQHFLDTDWAPEASGTAEDLRAVTGLMSRFGEPLRMYAVGNAGTVLTWKGGPWEVATLPAGAATMDFADVWAAAIDDVFAVASNSTAVLRYDDPYELGPWTIEQTPATSPLVAIGGWRTDTYAASAGGELLRHNGGGWKKIGQPGSITDIRGVSETAFYATGLGGTLRYYQDGKWSNFTPEFTGDFFGVWVRSGWNAVAVGSNGAVWVHRTN